jgi:hypothetical protein
MVASADQPDMPLPTVCSGFLVSGVAVTGDPIRCFVHAGKLGVVVVVQAREDAAVASDSLRANRR